MHLTRRNLLAAAAGLSALAVAETPALAGGGGTVVNVSLWDKGPDAEMGMGMGMAMHGAMAQGGMAHAAVGIDATPDSARAGEVTFRVKNTSKDMVHEMVLSPVADVDTPLPYIESESRVDEDAAGHLGEVAELDPGQRGALTLTLKPGTYILYCNIPGHYAAGMWTLFTVT